MRNRTPRLIALGCVALGAAVGCANLIGADFSGQHLVVCSPATYPPPPKIVGAGSGTEIVLVSSTISLGEFDEPDGAPGYATIGYSLDGLCGRDQACSPPAWTGAHPIKGLDGRDNGLGEMMHGQMQFFGLVVFHSDMLSDNIKKGINAPLLILDIAGYSGFVDDDDVQVSLYLASPQNADGTNFVPRWDGTDEWPLAPLPEGDAGTDGGASTSPAARFDDPHAYVSDYTLTARFPAGAIRFANVPFTTKELVVTGKIDPATKSISNGVVSGRMAISEMFRHVPEVTQLLLAQTLCIDNANYVRIKTYFCSFSDVRASTSATTGDCDGLSIGVAFETSVAKLGKVVNPIAVPGCPPETSSDNDTCATPPKTK